MSAAMDRAMMAMSIEEEDKPLVIPNRPEYSSCENNALSLVGRILNPDFQKVSNLIFDMPRKWQKPGRIRGVALNKERFQFFFKSEEDLVDILARGVQSFNFWAFALERWVEKPPIDFLQFVPLWVQIRHLPINNYRTQTILDIGETLGVVTEIAFDDTKSQSQPYVRVKILFNVAHPMRKSKVIELPSGEEVLVEFFFEQIQMRCHHCQRLNHAREVCPLLVKVRQDKAATWKARVQPEFSEEKLILKKSDPLFGVLKEEQVGVNPLTGRVKINPDVLEQMRNYLVAANGDDIEVKKERIKSTIAKVELDPEAQKTILRLEARPLVTTDVDKGKGRVFDFETAFQADVGFTGEKLLSGSLKEGNLMMNRLGQDDLRSKLEIAREMKKGSPSRAGFTEYGTSFSEAGPSGACAIKGKSRKRQVKRLRKINQLKEGFVSPSAEFKRHGKGVVAPKRKLGMQAESRTIVQRRKNQKVIPREGSPDI
uniref:DUF4283 domain-containing protein n=1 Tax=Noccaea caerulescens TaxID=107243 RepID=A0A1J3DP81_NOCCA